MFDYFKGQVLSKLFLFQITITSSFTSGSIDLKWAFGDNPGYNLKTGKNYEKDNR